jgi:hypothetical protein
MKKQDRLDNLLIDDDEVVGLDFGQISIRIAYALVQQTPPEGDLYEIGDHSPMYRDGFKKLFNSLLAARKPLTRKPQGTKALLPNVPFEKLLEEIKNKHPAIAGMLFTAACHQIQFVESQIMVQVLLRLKHEGVVGLPIHDGLVVAVSHEEMARTIMANVAAEVVGVEIPVSRE